MRIDAGRTPILTSFACILSLAASADVIYLKSGGAISGRIVSRTATAVEMDVGEGLIGVALSSVLRIEEGRSPLHEFQERASQIPAGNVEGWLALADWASAQGLGAQAREAYNRALSASPGDARANEALGNVYVDGRWVSGDDAYRARGYVRFEGEWMTPIEQDAILRERAADDERERQRVEGDLRAREAEARAQEAESRAREAEAKAAEAQNAPEGLPLWYGWGAGPSVWPTGPIVVPRAVPRPIVVPR